MSKQYIVRLKGAYVYLHRSKIFTAYHRHHEYADTWTKTILKATQYPTWTEAHDVAKEIGLEDHALICKMQASATPCGDDPKPGEWRSVVMDMGPALIPAKPKAKACWLRRMFCCG